MKTDRRQKKLSERSMGFAKSSSGFHPDARRELLNSNCIADRSIETKCSSIESSNFSIRWSHRYFTRKISIMTWKNSSLVRRRNIQEYHRHDPLVLRIHISQYPVHADAPRAVQNAVHNYFSYRRKLNRLELKRLVKQGRTSLVIGSPFLGGCLFMSGAVGAERTWNSANSGP